MKTQIQFSLEMVQDLLGLHREGFTLLDISYCPITRIVTFLSESDKHTIPEGMRPVFVYQYDPLGQLIHEVKLTPNGN